MDRTSAASGLAEHPAEAAEQAAETALFAVRAAEQRAEIAQRALAAEMAENLLEDVGRQAGRIGGACDGVAGLGMGLAERVDRRGHLFGGQADPFGEIGDRGIAGHLAEDAVQQTHVHVLR